MHMKVLVFCAIAIGLVAQVYGLKCLSCRNAVNNDECNMRGKVQICKSTQACVNEIVSTRDGSKYEIFKGCKNRKILACSGNDQQNTGVYPYKCNYKEDQSVCQCCCSTELCNGPQMECKDASSTATTCKKPDSPGNGRLRCPGTILFGSKCVVKCNRGYVREGPRTIVCMNGTDQGYWRPRKSVACLYRQISVPGTQPERCRTQIKEPQHGNVICENSNGHEDDDEFNYVGTKCAFRCDAGYYLSGPEVTECLPGGHWSIKARFCKQGVCHDPVQDKNRIDDCSDGYNIGSVCSLGCRKGYRIQGSSITTCSSMNGNIRQWGWSEEFPKCVRAECRPQLQIPSNGEMKCTNSNLLNSICSFYCNDGFDLTETDFRTAKVECSENGEKVEWSGKAPECRPIRCRRIETPLNGNIACEGDGRVGSTCTFRCNVGFDLVGVAEVSETTQCQDDSSGDEFGVWSVESVICAPIKCEPPREDPENGFVYCSNGNNLGSTCTFSCDNKYDLDGTEKKLIINVCLGDESGDGIGRWSENPGTCSSRFMCDQTQVDPDRGSVSCNDHSYLGSVCQFTCEEGYELNGIDRITCVDLMNDGDASVEWSDNAPECVISTCPVQWYDTTSMASRCDQPKVGSNYPIGTKCTYECLMAGQYIMYADNGNGDITCLKKNTWSRAAAPRCVVKTCKRLQKLLNGHQPKCTNENNFNSQCGFSCGKKYTLSHTDPVVCIDGDDDKAGTWDREQPTCVLNECTRVPPHPAKGTVTCSSGAKLGSYCTLECERGYAPRVTRVDCNYMIDVVDGIETRTPKFALVNDFCCAQCQSDLRFVQMVDGRYKTGLRKAIDFTKIYVTSLLGHPNQAHFATFMYNDEVFEDTVVESKPLSSSDETLGEIFDQIQTWKVEAEAKSSDTKAALNYANDVMFATLDNTASNFLIVSADDSPDNVDEKTLQNLRERGIHIIVVANNNFAKIKWERLLSKDSVLGQDSNILMEKIFDLAFRNGCSKYAEKCA